MDIQAFKARIGNERFPYVSGEEARALVAEVERLQREAAAVKGLIDSVRNIVHFANNNHNSAPNWATIRLEDALAHYIRAVQRGDE